jgi:hypothetical protein
MTKKIIQPLDKCIHRIAISLNNTDRLLLQTYFKKQSQYTTISSYTKAIVLGNVESKKSTILNVPSVNAKIAQTLKLTTSNINQHMIHLNTLKNYNDGEAKKYAKSIYITSMLLQELHKQIKNTVSILDKSDKNAETVKAMARHTLSTEDYLDLLSMNQLEALIDKKIGQIEAMEAMA